MKNLLKTAGWREVERILEEHIDKCSNEEVSPLLPSNTYKVNTLANKKAAKKLKDFLTDIKLRGGDLGGKNNISYK